MKLNRNLHFPIKNVQSTYYRIQQPFTNQITYAYFIIVVYKETCFTGSYHRMQ